MSDHYPVSVDIRPRISKAATFFTGVALTVPFEDTSNVCVDSELDFCKQFSAEEGSTKVVLQSIINECVLLFATTLISICMLVTSKYYTNCNSQYMISAVFNYYFDASLLITISTRRDVIHIFSISLWLNEWLNVWYLNDNKKLIFNKRCRKPLIHP